MTKKTSSSASGKSRTPKMPVRVGVFKSVEGAEQAVDRLLHHGFSTEEVTVFCSNREAQEHFPQEEPRGETGAPVTSAATGATLGGTLGGLTAIAGLATVGGPVLVAGGLAGLLTGGVVGGLAGAMLNRGLETEPSDYFDQAVAKGKILVAVEPKQKTIARLDMAEKILHEAGTEPLPLREG